MDNLAAEQDKILQRLERANVQGECGPKLNEPRDEEYWLSQPGSPKAKLDNEKPQGQTVNYDELIEAWKAGKVK
jgi:glycerol transport system substrate-binding protein